MKEIIIKENQEKELGKVEVDGNITIKLEGYYFSSEGIALLHELGGIAEDEGFTFNIEVDSEECFDILELVGITAIYNVKLMKDVER